MSADAVWALEVVSHDQDVDPHARALQQILQDFGTHPVGVTHGRLYLIAGPQSARLHAAVRDLCVDPIIARPRLMAFPSPDDDWLIEILPHPGVTDAEGDSLGEALARDGFPGLRARAGHCYHLHGALETATVAATARRLAHAVVERVAWRPASCPADLEWWSAAFMPDAAPDSTVQTIPMRGLDAAALQDLGARKLLSLPLQDLEAVRDHYSAQDRDPTDVELETIAQTWSEHCAHRTFKATIRHREPGAREITIEGLLKTT